MNPTPGYLTARTACFAARSLLEAEGYQVFRIQNTQSGFDLIGFKPDHRPLFVRVRTVRILNRKEKLREHLSDLIPIVQENLMPGEVQLWLHETGNWLRYRILPGGAILLNGERR